MEILFWVLENPNTVFTILLALHALAVTIVNLTPTPLDNLWVGKAYKVIEAMAGVLSATAKEYPGERSLLKKLKGTPP